MRARPPQKMAAGIASAMSPIERPMVPRSQAHTMAKP